MLLSARADADQVFIDGVFAHVRNGQAGAGCAHDVVADLIRHRLRHDARAAGWVGEAGLDSVEHDGRMHNGDKHEVVGPGFANAAKFAEEMGDIRDVIEDKGADDAIERVRWKWEGLTEIVLDPGDGARARFEFGGVEHALGKIYCGDLGTEARETNRVAASAAANVGDLEIGNFAQEWEGDAFFEDDERVGFGVVDRGPAVVSVASGEVLDFGRVHGGRG